MWQGSRRNFLTTAAGVAGASTLGAINFPAAASTTDNDQEKVQVLNPAGRVPLSFIIDDSTCLVNMGHFCTPQFAAAFPDRAQYKRPWQEWPREIPDSFVREFGEWCATHGVKGKYSIVPNPACVGWLDRELPGWSRPELLNSLKLVRELMVPNWDIHPEMITHTRVIDLKTGRPFPEIGPATIENSYPQEDKSVDEIAAYMAYALRILKNCDLPCEGITTPGGFGNRMKPELGLAVQQAVADVYAPEIPHYFKYVHGGQETTAPTLEHVSGKGTDNVQLTVNVPAGTGDWFGGWQGVDPPNGDRYCDADATSGRMVELIERGDPAVMLCHWPGMYSNGLKTGFEHFKNVVMALANRYRDQTTWMKVSEIARYWAARELTEIRRTADGLSLNAPFAAPRFTLRLAAIPGGQLTLKHKRSETRLVQVQDAARLAPSTYLQDSQAVTICVDLPRGRSEIRIP